MTEDTVFATALEKTDPAERAAYLDVACAGDAALRQRVESLLKTCAGMGDFLARPAVPPVDSHVYHWLARSSALTAESLAGASAGEAVGSRVGPYHVLQKLGEGGMGVVWAAEQASPVRRRVALKVIKPGMDSHQVIARFEVERQALALMDHTNIARVLDAGTTLAGRPYFVMELVRGLPITKYCDEMRLPLRDRLALFVTVCHAVQHAHQKGIIHRDLKPSNVLVAVQDGKPVPKVIDFGMAKALHDRLTDRSIYTEIGHVIGTPQYMSPEQAELSTLDVDTRADVYALGVVLYELLAGSTPLGTKQLRGTAYPEILRLIREHEPARPSTRLSQSHEALAAIAAARRTDPARLGSQLRGELDWVVMKCLEKDRTRRYETADALARDIERYLSDEPVEACPPSAAYRTKKFLLKHGTAVATAGAFLALLLAGVVASTTQAVRATRAEAKVREEVENATIDRDRAVQAEQKAAQEREAAEAAQAHEARERRRAETLEGVARRRLYASQMNLAYQAWTAGHLARTLELLEGQRPRFDEEDLRTFEWYYLWQVCTQSCTASWRACRGQVTALAFAPDGRTLATGTWGDVRLWGVPAAGESATRLKTLARGNIWTVAFSPDGQTLVTGGTDRDIQHWDLSTGQERAERRGRLLAVRAVALSPDGKTLLGGGGHEAKLWEAGTGRELLSFLRQHTIRAAAFSPDGKALALGCDDHTVRLWAAEGDSWRERSVLRGHAEILHSVAFSADGKYVASSSREIKVWDAATGAERATLGDRRARVVDVQFSPDGTTLATAGEDRTLRLWDVETGRERCRWIHDSPVSKVAFSPQTALVASATYDGMVRLWRMADVQEPVSLPHGAAVTSVVFRSDGKTLVSGGGDRTRVWDLATGHARASMPGPRDFIALSPDGKTLASPARDNAVKLWDAQTWREQPALRGDRRLERLAFSPDGRTLAAWTPWTNPWHVDLYDVGTRKLRAVLRPTLDVYAVTSVAFSPDGGTLAVGYQHWFVVLYEVATGRQKLVLTQDRGSLVGVASVAFSPDGRLLATGTEVGTVRLWEIATGEIRVTFKGHTHAVRALAFTPDGQTLASASDDATVRLWDVLTGQERATLAAHAGPVTAVAFAADGRTLVTGSDDGTLKLWRAATDRAAAAPRSDLDPDDPQSAAGLIRAGEQLRQAGRFPEAGEVYVRAAARLEALAARFPDEPGYGQAHTDLAYHRVDLCQVQGQYPQAEVLLAELVGQERRRNGVKHPRVAHALKIWGAQLLRQERYAEAEPLLRECWTIRAQAQPDLWSTFNAQSLLGGSLLGQGRYAEAESLLLAGYKGMRERQLRVSRVFDPRLTEALEQLIQLYGAWAKPEQAAHWREELEQLRGATALPGR